MTRILSLIVLLGLPLPVLAQTALTQPQARALNCAAMFYLGSSELRKAGRIDASAEQEVQKLAVAILGVVPGNRSQRNALMNDQIRTLARGRTVEQLLLEFGKVNEPCQKEFLR